MSLNNKILIILSGIDVTIDSSQNIYSLHLSKFFESIRTTELDLDLVNLDKDKDFDTLSAISETKILEFQIKMRNVSNIIILYKLIQGLPPASLKLFFEKTIVPGFAFSLGKNPEPKLTEKNLFTIGFTNSLEWEIKLPLGDLARQYIQKFIAVPTGLKNQNYIVGNIHSQINNQDTSQIQKLGQRIAKKILNQNIKPLDLF
jgi:putative NADPH-quinone reductase